MMVVPQPSTKPLAAFDLAVSLTDFVSRFNNPVVQGLVIAFLMVMGEISGEGLSQWRLTKENHSRQTLFLDGSHETLDMR